MSLVLLKVLQLLWMSKELLGWSRYKIPKLLAARGADIVGSAVMGCIFSVSDQLAPGKTGVLQPDRPMALQAAWAIALMPESWRA